MTKRQFLTAALGSVPLLTPSKSRAQEAAPVSDAGAIAAQVAGRVNLALDGTVEVLTYFLYVDGLGSDLFNGNPSERTAHFTLRADRLRPILVANADVIHMGFQPASGDGALYRVYYHSSPLNRDFTRGETFSQGQQIASFRARRTQATLVPGSHGLVTGTADLVESVEFQYKDRDINIANLYKKATFQFHARQFSLSDLGVTTLSIPLGGHLIKVG